MLLLVPLIILVASACGSAPAVRHAASSLSPKPAVDAPLTAAWNASLLDRSQPDPLPSGISLIPIRVPLFVFGPDNPAEPVQAGSLVLANLVPKDRRLHVVALPSPDHTAALNLVEDSTPRLKWGELLTPAQRTIFRAFAGDASLGQWLVIVDDVNVVGGPDPVPLTAYLWPRSVVVSYLQCGIPDTGIDSCTDAFYQQARMVLVGAQAIGHVG